MLTNHIWCRQQALASETVFRPQQNTDALKFKQLPVEQRFKLCVMFLYLHEETICKHILCQSNICDV